MNPPAEGVEEFIFCVYDEKQKLRHHFHSSGISEPSSDVLNF